MGKTMDFIVKFFMSKNLGLIMSFLCWKSDQLLLLSRTAQDGGFKMKIQNNFSNVPELPAYNIYREGVILDLNCPNAKFILQKASENRAFIHRYTWLLIHNSTFDLKTIESILSDTAILPDADVTWYAEDKIVDIYRRKEHLPFVVTDLEISDNSSVEEWEALWRRIPAAPTRRRDLNNLTLDAAVILSQPENFKGWSDLSNNQIDTYPKLTYPLMMICAEDLHIRYNLRQVDKYGEIYNSTFNGAAGVLQRQQAELVVSSVFMRHDRWAVMHFSAETVSPVSVFIFRAPSQSSVSNIFLLPLSGGVWWCVVCAACVSALLVAGLARWLGSSEPTLQQLTVPEAVIFSVGAVCQQGFHIIPSVSSIRVVMLVSVVTSLFTFTAYSAKIVSLLQTPSDALRSVTHLAHSHMDVGIQETTYKKVYYAESQDPCVLSLFRRKVSPQGERAYMSVVDGIHRMRTQLFAFQVERNAGYEIIRKTFTESEKCELKEIEAFKLPIVAVPLKKHSGYRELFGTRLRWLRETGLLRRLSLLWMGAEGRLCAGAGVGGFRPVRLLDMMPALKVLASGGVVAMILLILENLHYYYLKSVILCR